MAAPSTRRSADHALTRRTSKPTAVRSAATQASSSSRSSASTQMPAFVATKRRSGLAVRFHEFSNVCVLLGAEGVDVRAHGGPRLFEFVEDLTLLGRHASSTYGVR